jgi:hypothetical protein
MEEKVYIEQNGKATDIKTSNDIKEIEISFDGNYKVQRVKIVFKDEKDS